MAAPCLTCRGLSASPRHLLLRGKRATSTQAPRQRGHFLSLSESPGLIKCKDPQKSQALKALPSARSLADRYHQKATFDSELGKQFSVEGLLPAAWLLGSP